MSSTKENQPTRLGGHSKLRQKQRNMNPGENSKATRQPGKICASCYGQSWRRPVVGACKCGDTYTEEPRASRYSVGLGQSLLSIGMVTWMVKL